jgi:predicted transcriptional regulator
VSDNRPTEPITIRAAKDVVSDIDALASAMDRSRNYIVNQALQQYLEANAWQIERIKEGLTAADEGRVRPAEDVFADTAEGLTKFPVIGRAGRLPGTAEFLVPSLPYLIVYRVDAEVLTIVAVLHTSRDLMRALITRL